MKSRGYSVAQQIKKNAALYAFGDGGGRADCRAADRGGSRPVFSSGVMIRSTLEKADLPRALFLGRYAFKHAALRSEYEKDRLCLAPAGGKEKGWYVMTEGGQNPDAVLLEQWQSVCDAAGLRAAMYVEGREVKAFFNGNFYTGEFASEEELTASSFKRHSFAPLVPFAQMLHCLRERNVI